MCCMFVCVSASVSASRWQAMGTSSRVCQNGEGQGGRGEVGGGQRDDEEEVEIGSFL